MALQSQLAKLIASLGPTKFIAVLLIPEEDTKKTTKATVMATPKIGGFDG